ncbi:MAG: phage capsid protein [Rhizobiales bacterium 65-79]|nr:phage major capsid protein [Hyphomicrobiales bacterium]OJU03581.1 MAG: phage capsid protein [Rhizobiales bacterium 65-79]
MLKQLREKRAKLVAEMRGIIKAAENEDRDLTAEEQTAFDTAQASKADLDKRIDRLEGLEASEAALEEVVPAASRRASIQRPGGDPAAREFENMGEFLNAVRFHPNDQRLEFVEGVGAEADENGPRAEMRMDNDRQGGFMVPTQFRSTIMSVSPQDALVRPRANVIPAGSSPDAGITMPALDQSGSNPGNVFGGMTFSWIEEGGDKPETDAELRGVSLVPHEIAGFVTVTDKLLRNWQASAAFLENLMRGGVSAAEDYAFLRGTGVTKPLGALNAPVLKTVNRQIANQIVYLDLLKMTSILLMRGGQPVWSAPQSALIWFGQLQDPEGHYIWKPDARDGFAGTLMGYPLRWNNRAPALGSKGDLLFADWSYYLIKDGSGPFVAASEHVKFTSNKTVVKIFWNVDGAPWMNAPFTEENGYEVSPFVALDVPA